MLDERDAIRVEELRHCYQRGLFPALIWRSLSGRAVAGTYMPSLRALVDGMAAASHVAGWYISSFTLGSSLSFLLGQAGLMRTGALVNGALGVIGLLLAWIVLPHVLSPNGLAQYRTSARSLIIVMCW